MRRTGPSALALPATAIVASLWLVVACAVGSSRSPSPAASLATLPPAPSTLVTRAPAATPTASEPMATTPPLPEAQPPGGQLSSGGDAVDGELGSFCWNPPSGGGGCIHSATWPPVQAPAIAVPARETQLEFALADGTAFASWAAHYYATDGIKTLGGAGASFDPDANPSFAPLTDVNFAAPPGGTWIVDVSVRFGEGGDAVYAWNVTVP
jgi:hypothetical protein